MLTLIMVSLLQFFNAPSLILLGHHNMLRCHCTTAPGENDLPVAVSNIQSRHTPKKKAGEVDPDYEEFEEDFFRELERSVGHHAKQTTTLMMMMTSLIIPDAQCRQYFRFRIGWNS